MFNNFIGFFHIAILSAIVLSGCGYKGDPVYITKDGKTIEYNATAEQNKIDSNSSVSGEGADTNTTTNCK